MCPSTRLWVKAGSEGTWTSTSLTQNGSSGTFNYTPISGDGTYYFATVATDNAGNVETSPSGDGDTSTEVESVKPASGASSPAYETTSTVEVTWTASDATSGVSSTRLWVKYGTGAWTITGLTQSGTSGTFNYTPSSGDGTYYFATVAVDNAGNAENNPVSIGDTSTVVDRVKPASSVTVPEKTLYGDIQLPWTANDATSGVVQTKLYVKFNGGTWQSTGITGTGTSGTFDYTLTESGTYAFGTRATDVAGNLESISSDGSLTYYGHLIFAPMSVQNHIEPYAGALETEPNNNYLDADGPIESGKTYQGQLLPDQPNGVTAKDYYKLYMVSEGTITIELSQMPVGTGQLFLFYEDTDHIVKFNNAVGSGCTLTYLC